MLPIIVRNIVAIAKRAKLQKFLRFLSIAVLLVLFLWQPQKASAFSLHEFIGHFYSSPVKNTPKITNERAGEKVLGVNTSKLLAQGPSNNTNQSSKNDNGLSFDKRIGALETKLSQLSFLQSQNNFNVSTLDSAGVNLLRNSSFETGGENNLPSQWKTQLDSSVSNTFLSKEGIHSGNFGLKFLGGGTGNFGISQPDGRTTPQRTYTLSLYVKVVNAASTTFRLGFWDEYNNKEGNFKNFSFSGTQDWKRISMRITTPGIITDSKNYYPMIQVQGLKSGNIYIDDVQLTEGSVLTVYNTAAAKGGGGVTLGDGSILASNDGNIYPAQSGVGSLGTTSNQWQALNLSNASIDSNGNLSLNGGATVGGTATVNGAMTAKGNVVLGSSSSNTITATGLFNSNIIPSATTTYDLGSTSLYWNNLYVKTLTNSSSQSIGGNLSVTGTLGVTGAATFSSTGSFASTLTASNGLTLSTGALSLTATSGSANLTFSSSTTALNVNSQFDIDTTNNRVGIGTTAPSNKLDVNGAVAVGSYAGGSPTAPSNGLIVSGNVGIGTSTPGSALQINGAGVIGFGGAPFAAPSQGLVVGGNVGIGTSSPSQTLHVQGTEYVSGNIGIGTSSPGASLAVAGGGLFGYSGTQAAPTNGLSVFGNVGIGTTSPLYNLQVVGTTNVTGNTTLGGILTVSGTTTLTGSTTSSSTLSLANGSAVTPALNFTNSTGAGLWRIGNNQIALTTSGNTNSGLAIDANGNVGIGTTGPTSILGVAGTAAIGSGYAIGSPTTPSNGLIVQGNVGIGTSTPNAALQIVGATALGWGGAPVVTAPTNGLAVSGNVGIGTTVAGASLQINGNSIIGYGSASTAGPVNGLAVSGNVGIGTTSPVFNLQVVGTQNTTGAVTFGSTGSFVSTLTASNGLTLSTGALSLTSTSGTAGLTLSSATNAFAINTNVFNVDTTNSRVGIGTATPSNKLDVNGAVAVGSYAGGSPTAPSNGLIVSGNVGIGTSTPGSALQINGGGVIGFGGAPFAAPSQGLVVGGNVGIGTSSPGASLTVAGGALIGYTGTQVAPSNGLAVFGNVGIGTSSPAFKLDVAGGGRFNCGNTTWNTGPSTTCSDVAEVYNTDEQLEKGDVIRIVSEGKVGKTKSAYDAIIGVYSTSPGLLVGGDARLGGEADVNLPSGKVPVALAGRVPTKVSIENGPIAIGDVLTASSIPGVAMKATKAGPILGSSLEAYSGKELGKIMVFVQSGYFNGIKTKDLLAGLQFDGAKDVTTQGVDSPLPDLASLLLAQFIAQKEQLAHSNTALSEIVTDRVAAGLEIVTPKLIASEVTTKSLSSKENEDLLIQIGKNNQLVIQTKQSANPAVTIDTLGNAIFAGNITAKKVKADSIEGLEVITDNLVSLSDKLNGLSLQTQNVQKTASQAASATTLSLVNLSVQQAQVGLDMTVVGKLTTNGGLVVGGPAEFKANVLFAALADFVGNVIFRGDVNFFGRPTFNKDTAGFALIKKGADAVYVPFQRAYDQNPVVSISITLPKNADGGNQTALEQTILTGDIKYIVTSLAPSGFVIKLNKAASADTTFSWTALSVKDTAVITSQAPAVSQPEAKTNMQPSPTVSPTAAPAGDASITVTPTITQVPAPILSPSVSASPTPTVVPPSVTSSSPVASPTPTTVTPTSVTPSPTVSPTP